MTRMTSRKLVIFWERRQSELIHSFKHVGQQEENNYE